MIYVLLSGVFLTLFLFIGAWSFFGFVERMKANFPINWTCYQHVIFLALIAFLCFIAAAIFGLQIPDCYATTIL